jgi:hypothetical protein
MLDDWVFNDTVWIGDDDERMTFIYASAELGVGRHCLIQELSRLSVEVTEKNHERTARISGVQSVYLQNASLARHNCAIWQRKGKLQASRPATWGLIHRCEVLPVQYAVLYSKTSLIRTNWERTLVQISERLNYRSDTENCSGKL